jgi:hypothetical protein
MTDAEYCLYKARLFAARRYRTEGYDAFATRIEAGLEDSCSLVRVGLFFNEPHTPPEEAFVVAWDEAAALSCASS